MTEPINSLVVQDHFLLWRQDNGDTNVVYVQAIDGDSVQIGSGPRNIGYWYPRAEVEAKVSRLQTQEDLTGDEAAKPCLTKARQSYATHNLGWPIHGVSQRHDPSGKDQYLLVSVEPGTDTSTWRKSYMGFQIKYRERGAMKTAIGISPCDHMIYVHLSGVCQGCHQYVPPANAMEALEPETNLGPCDACGQKCEQCERQEIRAGVFVYITPDLRPVCVHPRDVDDTMAYLEALKLSSSHAREVETAAVIAERNVLRADLAEERGRGMSFADYIERLKAERDTLRAAWGEYRAARIAFAQHNFPNDEGYRRQAILDAAWNKMEALNA